MPDQGKKEQDDGSSAWSARGERPDGLGIVTRPLQITVHVYQRRPVFMVRPKRLRDFSPGRRVQQFRAERAQVEIG